MPWPEREGRGERREEGVRVEGVTVEGVEKG